MSWIIVIIATVSLAMTFFISLVVTDKDIWAELTLGTVLVGMIVLVVMGGRTWARHIGVNNCDDFGVEAEVDTKFVDYHYFSWECLVRDDDFGWVPKSNYWNSRP